MRADITPRFEGNNLPSTKSSLNASTRVTGSQCEVLSLFAAFMALDLLVISFGYALSRESRPGATALYVIGQLLAVAVPIFVLIELPRMEQSTGLWIAAIIGLITFLTTQAYSPIRFDFSDAYQHLQTAQNILSSHHLFGHNSALAVSPEYPGMEIAATAISSISHASVYVSGTIVAGVSHILMTALLYILAVELGLTPRAAAFAVIVFSTGTDYEFFLSYFAYETFAMPFMLATLILTLRAYKANSRSGLALFTFGAISTGFVTIVAHHITSYFMWILLIAFLTASFFRRSPRWTALRILGVIVPISALLALWDLSVATYTFHYLSQIPGELFPSTHGNSTVSAQINQQALDATRQVGKYVTSGKGTAPTGANPVWIRLLADISSMLLAALIVLGAWRIWRTRTGFGIPIFGVIVVSATYFGLAPIFLLSPAATTLGPRAQAFVLIPVGIVAGVALDIGVSREVQTWRFRLVNLWERRWKQGSFVLAACLIVIGGIANNLPTYFNKLPEPDNVAASQRSTDPRTVVAGMWIGKYLGPNAPIAADHAESFILQAVGGAEVPFTALYQVGVGYLIESDKYTPLAAAAVQVLNLKYIVADYRMTTELPVNGEYFLGDPFNGHFLRPLPRETLTKFNDITGVSRLFDDGKIVIYDTQTSLYDYGS